MKKKGLALVLVLLLMLSVSTVAIAGPTFEATIYITGNTVVEVGQSTTLTATWTTNQDVTRSEWSVEGTGQGVVSFDGTSSGTSNFIFDATGKTVGYYDVCFRIWHHTQTNRDDTECEEIEVIEQTMTIYVTPMAAPAIAAKILEFNKVPARYGSGKLGGNYISDVAHNMGPQTDFNGIVKEEWCASEEMYVSNPAYRQAVFEFLEGETGLVLDMPTDAFFMGM